MPALLFIVTLIFLTCDAEARAPSAAVIVSTTTWHVGHDLTCTVTEGIDHERTLAIRDGTRVLFRDADYLQFVSMFTTRDLAGPLITVWISANAYRIRVLSYHDGKVTVALDDYSSSFPEMFDLDHDGVPEIVLRDRTYTNARPDTPTLAAPVSVYKWTANTYTYLPSWSGSQTELCPSVAPPEHR